MDNEISFFIVRCITNISNAPYWRISYDRIRHYYPESKIFIVDDHSKINTYGRDQKSIWEELPNCEYIRSEYPKRGEILGYYYFHQRKPSQKAIILHDSVFINSKLEFEQKKEKCTFLWTFHPNTCLDTKSKQMIINTLRKFNDKSLLVTFNRKSWRGCFGIMSIIDYDFLDFLDKKYKLFSVLLQVIQNRFHRQCLERIFGCLCYHHYKGMNPLLGDIKRYCKWDTKFHQTMIPIQNNYQLPMIKVWTGR